MKPILPPPDKTRRLRITCGWGLPPFLRKEVEALGFKVVADDTTGVEVNATAREVMRLNLQLRTAQHVRQPITSFRADNPDELHRRLMKLSWETLIPSDGYVSVVSNVDTPSIDNATFASLRVKDAIVDRLLQKTGRRPDSGPERDRAVVHLYWNQNQAVLSVDTSGQKLSDRGYRKRPHSAPMQETLAAAVLIAAGYDGSQTLVLPMCGSGTLAIEAALIATRRAPGLLRSNFAFMHLQDYDEPMWREVRKEALGRGQKIPKPARIIATDIDPKAIEAANANAKTAGVDPRIEFGVCDFEKTPVPEGGGLVILNPEYGLRLGELQALEKTYARIGDFFKKKCAGYTGFIFTGNMDLAKKVGLRTKRRIPFWNASIECRLLAYELYSGTRKKKSDDAHPTDANQGGDQDQIREKSHDENPRHEGAEGE